MAQFDYTAKSRDGKSISGTVDAADRRGAISAVERLGLTPLLLGFIVGIIGILCC
jgi:type II secretory pathway component PulF